RADRRGCRSLRRRGSMRPRVRPRLAALGAIAVIAVIAGIGAWWRFGPGSGVASTAAAAAPRYVDETTSSGLVHTYDGSSDVAVGNYVDPTSTNPTTWCEPNELVRPGSGSSGFGPPLPLSPSWCTLSMLFSDWDGSGRADLRVSNDLHYYPPDLGQEQLWKMVPGEAPRMYSAADGWLPVQVQGMGIASRDLTGDGLPEIFLTSQAANRLQTLTAGS